MVISLTSCKDNPGKVDTKTYKTDSSYPEKKVDTSNRQSLEEDKGLDSPEKTEPETLSGLYIRDDHPEDTACNCYCLDVQLNSTAELCLAENDLYIYGRFEQEGDLINIYYSGKSPKNTNTEIPWDEFDRNLPIAVLRSSGEGMKLDWKGFSINEQIAVDYALYGKKTLEGNYKKK